MQDASLPFRPRVSSPVDRALASIEAQTSGVRRRVNRFVLEGAVFVTFGALLLAFAMLVVLAFLLSQTQFALGMWGVLSLLAFIVATSLRKARRTWISKSGAALRIDRQADLQDRLATLTSAPAQARRSKLWDVLLHENLRLLPRWEPRRLQPRATPRSIWFFVLSAVFAFLASRELPGRGDGGGAPFTAGEVATPEAEGPEEGVPSDDSGPATWSLWSDLPEDLRQAILGARASRNYAGNIPEKTQPLDRDRGGPAIAGRRMASNGGPVRSVPADADAARFAGQGSAGAPQPASTGTGRESENPGRAQAARGDAPKALQGVESGRSRNSAAMTRAHRAKNEGGAGSGGAGAGSGSDKDGLFGERQEPGKATGSFALNLDALRSGEPSSNGEDASETPPMSRLAEDQRLDDAVRRAQVPVEYEVIVQRLFNRAAETQP